MTAAAPSGKASRSGGEGGALGPARAERGKRGEKGLRASSSRSPWSAADFLVKAVVLATPVCYALGRVYAESYWSALDVAPSAMAGAFEDYVFFSFVMLANGVAWAVSGTSEVSFLAASITIVLLIVLFSVLAWLLAAGSRWLRPKIRRFVASLRWWARKRRSAARSLKAGAAAYSVINTIILMFFMGSLALLLPMAAAKWLAEHQATKLRDALRTETDTFNDVVSGTGVERVEGRLVHCAEQRCVIYARNRFIPVPADSVRWARPGASPVRERAP